MGFTTPSYSLIDLFARAERGELQLPDFQREYIWDVDRIRTLITSVLRGYPVGSFLALDTRNSPVRFRPRPLAGLDVQGAQPGLLLLDGQQRLTSLYHAFKGEGLIPTVDYLGEPINRRFFVDVRAAVASDPMPVESVFAVDEEGRIRSHFGPVIDGGITTREDMLRHGVIPVSLLLWKQGNDLLIDMAAGAEDPEMREAVKKFQNEVLRWLPAYDVPVIRVDRDTSRVGVGQIFAHANSAGVQMDVFELLTAMFASQDPDFVLAEHWANVEKQLRAYPALDRIGRIEFLRALALLVSSRRGHATGHRGDILAISLDEYRAHADEVLNAFVQVAEFLADRSIFTVEQVPYSAQLVPLATILARLAEHPGALENQDAQDRLNRWFWSGVFGELYGAHAPTIRAGLDVTEVTPWVLGETDEVPNTVADAEFATSRLLSATADSGIYRGMFALLMARGARDWRTGKAFDRETIAELQPSFNTVFPPNFCASIGADSALANSVLNRTPMGRRTEVVIENNAPKRYLPRLQSKSLLDDAEFDAVIEGHEINANHLLASDWEAFLEDRLTRLIGMVEYALDKPVIRDLDCIAAEPHGDGANDGAPTMADHVDTAGHNDGHDAEQ
ncbi:DUF262 domain-containing protein [Corynebacterium sp. TA-R-1]|uniref:DUF262 domain-containing protein n=1 Tax=Corynebacterium stercoris TaxID=2943490 RepID=A0ABT1FZS8_9CORY|nr:DUF262 domain-containing protein [Corynebacterium stercoris]MCP1387263.1 DUF262 domain-containing protein [Corynebacterium stercoris]